VLPALPFAPAVSSESVESGAARARTRAARRLAEVGWRLPRRVVTGRAVSADAAHDDIFRGIRAAASAGGGVRGGGGGGSDGSDGDDRGGGGGGVGARARR